MPLLASLICFRTCRISSNRSTEARCSWHTAFCIKLKFAKESVWSSCSRALKSQKAVSNQDLLHPSFVYTDASNVVWSTIMIKAPHVYLPKPHVDHRNTPLAFLYGPFSNFKMIALSWKKNFISPWKRSIVPIAFYQPEMDLISSLISIFRFFYFILYRLLQIPVIQALKQSFALCLSKHVGNT